MKIDITEINKVLDEEIEFAKGCVMPQFVMGLQQAKKILNQLDDTKEREANKQHKELCVVEKFHRCYSCHKETATIDTKEGKTHISCICGLYIVLDEEGNTLIHRWGEKGNTYCVMCGDKVEGGYCNCFNR